MVSQRDEAIAELRDEACTLWASGWLALCCRAATVFPGLDFNFQVPDEEEAEESIFEDEADLGLFSYTPSSVPLPSEAEVPTKASFLLSPAGVSPFNLHGSKACTSEAARSSSSNT